MHPAQDRHRKLTTVNRAGAGQTTLTLYPSLRWWRFVRGLLTWRRSCSDAAFPWRTSGDPYRILIAELMLQRTQAVQVRDIFLTFVERFPNPHSLTEAAADDLNALLAPLGLKKRVAAFLRVGKDLVERFEGQVPRTEQELKTIFGVGDYTAAAVLSFAYGLPVPLVDANVERVLARALEIRSKAARARTDKRYRQIVGRLIPKYRPREFNLALVDLGIQVCRSRAPRCNECPIKGVCLAAKERRVDNSTDTAQKFVPQSSWSN